MGRPIQGWKLRRKGTTYHVYFTWQGRQIERSTRESDAERAAKVGAQIYADETRADGPTEKRGRSKPGGGETIEAVATEWLNSVRGALDPLSIAAYADHVRAHLVPHFRTISGVTEQTVETYKSKRLRQVRAATVRKELSALRGVMRYAETNKIIRKIPPIKGIPKKVMGTPYKSRRRKAAPELSPDEIEAMIARLPEWSTSRRIPKFPIRARFIVAYETSLRPELLDQLSVPEHYSKGSTKLTFPDEVDKARFGRTVPLSVRSCQALDSVLPAHGLIFGKHNYSKHLGEAAKAVLPKVRADIFTGAHFRSAAITHMLERTKNVAGVQYLAGHKHMSTTARYVRATERAAEDVLRELGAR